MRTKPDLVIALALSFEITVVVVKYSLYLRSKATHLWQCVPGRYGSTLAE